MRKTIFLVVLLCAASFQGFTQSLKTDEAISSFCSKFLDAVFHKDYDLAIESLRQNSYLPESDIKQLRLLIESNLDRVDSTYGLCVGFESLPAITLGKSFQKVLILQKFVRYAIKWEFTFYNAGSYWKLTSILFNDKIDELLK